MLAMLLTTILGSIIAMIPRAWAASAEWDMNPYAYSDIPGGIHQTNIKHSGNQLVNNMVTTHVDVYYADTFHAADPLANIYNLASGSDFTVAGKDSWWWEYYIGDGVACTPTDWKNSGCYKYKAFYDFYDPAGTASAKFKPVMQVFGPGYQPCGAQHNFCGTVHGWGFYLTHWRADVNAPGGGLGDYSREKDPLDCTGWIELFVEQTVDYNGCTGQQWRVHDSSVGYSKSLGIDPITTDGEAIVDLRMPSIGMGDERSPDGSQYISGESISIQDIVIWYHAGKQGSISSCYPGFPCKVESAWIPNGGW
jgi:hypothetical protein